MAASSSANIPDIQILVKLEQILEELAAIRDGMQFSNELNVHIHEERQLNNQIFKELEAISHGMQLINYKAMQLAKQFLEELQSFNCQILEKLAFCQKRGLAERQQEDSPHSIHQQSPSSKPPIGNDSGQGNVRQDSRSACYQASRKTSEGEKRSNQMRNAKLLCLLNEDSEFISESLNSDKHEAVYALGSAAVRLFLCSDDDPQEENVSIVEVAKPLTLAGLQEAIADEVDVTADQLSGIFLSAAPRKILIKTDKAVGRIKDNDMIIYSLRAPYGKP